MSFRMLRVKRRIDQDPAASLYLPVSEESKRVKSNSDQKEFKLFKLIDHENRSPITIVNPTLRQQSKVFLLSDKNATGSVAEAVLMDDKVDKDEITNLQKNIDLSDKFEALDFDNNDSSDKFVYDIYRMDLGRFTQNDIDCKYGAVEIITYNQEFLNEESDSESDVFEDEDDSNAEDYYANDYPDEESYLSEHDQDFSQDDGSLEFSNDLEIVDIDDVFNDSEFESEFLQDADVLDYYDSYVESDEQNDFDGNQEHQNSEDGAESNY